MALTWQLPVLWLSLCVCARVGRQVADVFGLRVVPVGGGEIRGAGKMWVCPEGELDPHSVNVDCWAADIQAEQLLADYLPSLEMPPGSVGPTHGEAQVRGALLMP